MWNEKCMSMERRIHDLTMNLSKMEEDKLRRESEYQEALRREKERMCQVSYYIHVQLHYTVC